MSTVVRSYGLVYAGTINTGALAAGNKYGTLPGLNSSWFCQATFPQVTTYAGGRVWLFGRGISMGQNTAEGSFRTQVYGWRADDGGSINVNGSGITISCWGGSDPTQFLIYVEDGPINTIMNYWVWAPGLNY